MVVLSTGVWGCHYTEGVRKTRQRPLSSRVIYPFSCNAVIIFCNAERLMPVSSCRYAYVAWSSRCIVRYVYTLLEKVVN